MTKTAKWSWIWMICVHTIRITPKVFHIIWARTVNGSCPCQINGLIRVGTAIPQIANFRCLNDSKLSAPNFIFASKPIWHGDIIISSSLVFSIFTGSPLLPSSLNRQGFQAVLRLSSICTANKRRLHNNFTNIFIKITCD